MPDSAFAASICTRRRSTISRHRCTKSTVSTSRGICVRLADGIEIAFGTRRRLLDDVGDVELHRAHAGDDEAHADLVLAWYQRAPANRDRDGLTHRESEGLLAGDGVEGQGSARAFHRERRVFRRDGFAVDSQG